MTNYSLLARAWLIVLICILQTNLVFAQSSTTGKSYVPQDQFLALLSKGEYKSLNMSLQAIQIAYIADSSTENEIHKAAYVFYRADPLVGEALDKWVNQRPNDAFSYLARGIYRTKMGWTSRGNAWASDTSNSQFSDMAAWFDAAKKDLNQAIKLDSSLVEAVCYLIEIDMNEGGYLIDTLFHQALKINASSFIAREFYLHSQLPRWGGTYEEMQKTITATKPYYKNVPQLKVLEGRISADLGEVAFYNKKYNEAINQYKRALAYGDFWFYNQKMGEVLWETDDYKGAIDQFSRVISVKPGYKRAWWMRSQAYKMQGNYPEAIADITHTINIEPKDDLAIAARGYIYQMSGDLTSALNDFKSASELNPTRPEHKEAVATLMRQMSKK